MNSTHLAHPLPTTNRFSFPRSTRPQHPPHSISFRTRPAPFHIRSALNGTLSDTTSVAMSLYDLLGIPETGSLLEIKQAYKQLARKYHPDVSPPELVEENTQRFIQVQEAYETLSDPRRRALYDHHVASGLHLAFAARRNGRFDEEMGDRFEWKDRWESQLSELKRRSVQKESADGMSWGARMRRERNGVQ
ncbi:chaperone protein dnaJ 20, chloroplastic-like [Salvia divinorum]|uniref:Chaperone protein dnaJ 20, chloroplastic-like n=1 Tax=Salvia divinorum TaxID=28513 RepID=A0ABD1GVU8_SALDI